MTNTEKKTRTITLTNRAPIQIVEDEWPVIAQGTCSWKHPDCANGWSIEVRVRKGRNDYIIHANYSLDIKDREDKCQRVRVGHVITDHEATKDLWKIMLEVGEELRSRIKNERLKKYVTFAFDQCFASLKPLKMG